MAHPSAAGATVRVQGLNELVRDFGRLSKELRRDLQRELQHAADPVALQARALLLKYDPRSAAGIRARVRGSTAFVEQRRRKTTGRHPEYGALQMRKALLPALYKQTPTIVKGLDELLGRLAGEHGF